MRKMLLYKVEDSTNNFEEKTVSGGLLNSKKRINPK